MQQEHAEGRGGLLSEFSPSAHPQDFFLCPNKLAPATQASLRGRRSKGKGKGIRARKHARPNSRFPFPFQRKLAAQMVCFILLELKFSSITVTGVVFLTIRGKNLVSPT